jgi:UDP-N-acetylmuramate--alanine ligase
MECLGRTILHVPGRHNVANAVAAAGLALLSGIDASTICSALASFRGARRRSELIRQAGGITLVDDYAHHPTEIQVTLAALRTRWRPKRLICVFQPHQHSRTRCFMEEFARSFTDADMVIVPDIHFARDTAADESGVKAGTLVEKINHAGVNALHLPQFTQVVEYLDAHRRPGDLIISMGAGNVWKVTHELAKRI